MQRLFTREEAESTLPHIASLLWKLKEIKPEYDAADRKLEELGRTTQTNGHAIDIEIAHASTAKQRIAAEMQGMIDRINELGVVVKDIEMGLVDFLSRVNDREVFLCWKLGEERIEWWHEVDAGYAARQRLD